MVNALRIGQLTHLANPLHRHVSAVLRRLNGIFERAGSSSFVVVGVGNIWVHSRGPAVGLEMWPRKQFEKRNRRFGVMLAKWE